MFINRLHAVTTNKRLPRSWFYPAKCILPCVLLYSFVMNPRLSIGDYSLAEHESHYLILDSASVHFLGNQHIRFQLNGKAFILAIDHFFMADRICSSAICTGGYGEIIEAYLSKAESELKAPGPTNVLLEVSLVKGSEDPFVSYLSVFPAAQTISAIQTVVALAYDPEITSARTPDAIEHVLHDRTHETLIWLTNVIKAPPSNSPTTNSDGRLLEPESSNRLGKKTFTWIEIMVLAGLSALALWLRRDRSPTSSQ